PFPATFTVDFWSAKLDTQRRGPPARAAAAIDQLTSGFVGPTPQSASRPSLGSLQRWARRRRRQPPLQARPPPRSRGRQRLRQPPQPPAQLPRRPFRRLPPQSAPPLPRRRQREPAPVLLSLRPETGSRGPSRDRRPRCCGTAQGRN